MPSSPPTFPAPSRRAPPFWFPLIASAALAACGGGGSSDGSVTASSASPDVHAFASVGAATTDADTTWTTVASEGQRYTVDGTQTVRYGAGSNWIARQVTGGGDCTNAAFGSDPLVGTGKSCQVGSTTVATSTWTRIAGEGATFTVAGTQTVRYGAGSSWITKSVTGSGTCSNAFFGNDPAYGVIKSCEVEGSATTTPTPTPTPTTPWTRIAGENAAFTVAGTQTVRYGAGSAWITKSVTGSGTCSNAFFGNDPAYGVVKSCEVASSTGTTTPTPVATAGVCTVPAAAVDTSASPATVGNGSAASCTEAALRSAVAASSVVRFACGTAPVTIAIGRTIDLPTERDTVIDGGGTVTLDGQNQVRILSLDRPNYRVNNRTLTLQHLALVNGRAPAGGYVAPNASNPSCAYGYQSGGGAAVAVRDAKLYVFDVDFRNNAAATPGPDIGGGAIYAMGSLDVLVAGSRFSGNSGANGGAINMLNSNLRIYNSAFDGNLANGVSAQVVPGADTSSCPGVGGPGQAGAGGGGGAVSMDGGDDTDVVVCGSTFTGNRANAQAGALQRVADQGARAMTIDRSTFKNNSGASAGAVYLQNLSPLKILGSTFTGNSAVYAGAGQLQSNTFTIENSTFAGNAASRGVGGVFLLSGNSAASVIRNATFANNRANGGPGYFAAALFGDANFAVSNTVFANNATDDPWNPMQCGFTPYAGSSDLQWPRVRSTGTQADTACVTGIAFADPLLGALADNGGSTPTLAPASASPLRGAGRNCPATDQRGVARNTASCTVGAVE